MGRNGKIILVLIAAAIVLGSTIVLAQPERQYRQMYDVPTSKLLQKGQAWLERDGGADSALVCFSLAASRYNDAMSRSDKEMMVRANIGKWLVYFSYLFDYPKAYESLQAAIDISDKAGINKAKTRLSMGGMLHLIADQSGSPDLYRKAVAEYSGAIQEARNNGDDHTLDIAFVNMIVASRSLGETAVLAGTYRKYGMLGGEDRLPRRRFAKALYHSVSGDTAAFASLEHELSLLPGDKEYVRLRFIGLKTLAELYMERKDPVRAEVMAFSALAHAEANGISDAEQEAHLLLSDILRQRGDMAGSIEHRDRYLRIKEETMGAKQLHRLDELRFLADLRTAEEQLTLSREQRRRQTVMIIGLCVLVTMAVAFIWVVIHKNIRLRQANTSLSHRYQSALAADDRERKLLRRIADIEEKLPAQKDDAPQQAKYGRSSLGDKERERILARLAELTAEPELICTPGCSIGKLAEAIGCNTKYLSQIINDEYKCNFNAFINEIRIKEASRRILAGGEWDKLTMEAIANSVGFKSRSTFSQFFKQFTGMTPTEFKRRGGIKAAYEEGENT